MFWRFQCPYLNLSYLKIERKKLEKVFLHNFVPSGYLLRVCYYQFFQSQIERFIRTWVLLREGFFKEIQYLLPHAVQSLSSQRRVGARFFPDSHTQRVSMLDYIGVYVLKYISIPGSTWSKKPLYFGINICKTCFKLRKKWQFRVCRVRRERGQDFF